MDYNFQRSPSGANVNHTLSSFLNMSRWFAALLVLVSHTRHLILVDLNRVQHQTLLVKALYFFTGLGHEAVVIFFVISGFLVGGVSLDRWLKHGPAVVSYAAARISRIYTVLLPALSLGFILDLIGLNWVNASELYTNPGQFHTISLANTLSGTINLPTFFGNLFMLQGVVVDNLGSNGPLWSLSYEWWYYCLFALAGAAFTARTRVRYAYGVASVILAVLLPEKILLWGVIWLLGIAAYAWIKSDRWHPQPWVGLAIFCVAIVISRMSHNQNNVENRESLAIEFARDLGVAVAFVFAIASVNHLKRAIPLARMHLCLANFSYTLYLVHFPMLMFVVATGYQVFGVNFQVQPSSFSFVHFALVTIGIFASSFLLSRVTEANTAYVKHWVTRVLAGPSRQVPTE